MSFRRDHPRACGEHLHRWGIYGMSKGSSPRMRGTRGAAPPGRELQGIIPAHAGNTESTSSGQYIPRDHPRACGEHSGSSTVNTSVAGSSPRMRGTLRRRPPGSRCPGIIPAHAGNTAGRIPMASILRDHPRACGEHLAGVVRILGEAGSSPRMRGTRDGLDM